MKSVKIKINRWTIRVYHRFLPIACSIQSIYRFLSIDYLGYITSRMTKGLVTNGGVYESKIGGARVGGPGGGGGSTGYLI